MTRATLLIYAQFLLIATLGTGCDQLTKRYAEERLASPRVGHEIVLTAPAGSQHTVASLLTQEFTWSTPEHIDFIARRHVRAELGKRIGPDEPLEPGQVITLSLREIEVIPGYFDLQYTRNPGAAFGFLAHTRSPYRMPFFFLMTLIALAAILYIVRGLTPKQQLVLWGLSLIAGGAAGNFIDRVRFGYVIDFILWKYTDAHRFPTFNIADVLICVGVGLMFLEVGRELWAQRAHQDTPYADKSA